METVKLNGKEISKEDFSKEKEIINEKKDTQLVKLNEKEYKTRLLG